MNIKKAMLIALISLGYCGCKTSEMTMDERNLVIGKIDQIYAEDQKYAGMPPAELTEKYGSKKAWEIFKKKRDSINAINQVRINLIFNQYGYPGYDKVGAGASDKFYITVQHADSNTELQKKILRALKKEIKNNNASRSNFALLYDRILVNEGKKQLFGTQVSYRKNGQAFPKNGIRDSLNVDELRKQYGLISLKEYLNDLTRDHFEMNRSIFEKLKINEPQLYHQH